MPDTLLWLSNSLGKVLQYSCINKPFYKRAGACTAFIRSKVLITLTLKYSSRIIKCDCSESLKNEGIFRQGGHWKMYGLLKNTVILSRFKNVWFEMTTFPLMCGKGIQHPHATMIYLIVCYFDSWLYPEKTSRENILLISLLRNKLHYYWIIN